MDRNLIAAIMRNTDGVALRKESVDRNRLILLAVAFMTWSLSARRAWIEISKIWYCGTSIGCRSPQGERG